MPIHTVAVLGAGVMGSGIAAHASNAGAGDVLLLDMASADGRRDAIAAGAVERMLGMQPAPFMHRGNARRIRTGNFDDDLGWLAEADWIIEAVIEKADIKRDLYRRIDAVRRPGSIVSSNTSTIPLAALVEGASEAFRGDFLITHFFNPPRYMRLLELVAGPDTRPEALETVREFADRQLGKGVVDCNDTPGFIANRLGIYWLQVAALEAIAHGLTVEEADAVVGTPMGIPRTGVFGLLDLVGIDLMPHVLASMRSTLPGDDPLNEYATLPPIIDQMIEAGLIGRKGKGGFYRLNRSAGGRVKEAIDLETGEYRPAGKPRVAAVQAARSGGLAALVANPDPAGRYAWRVLGRTLAYAASLVPEVSDDLAAVDEAMRLGYNWKRGPFELLDDLGPAWFTARLEAEGRPVPALLTEVGAGSFYRVSGGLLERALPGAGYRPVRRAEGVLSLTDIKRASRAVAGNGSASLWDIGDGIACLEFHSKMNAIDQDTLAMMHIALERIPAGFAGLVIHNEGENFSVGVNLGLALFAANMAAWDQIASLVTLGQQTFTGLRAAPFPVVAGPSGMALGGGCEVLLACDAIEAHAETYIGLVEVGVGLIPAWGGCTRMLERWSGELRVAGGPMPPVAKVFELVSTAHVSRSAAEARAAGFLRPGDGVVMNRDRVLHQAKSHALALVDGYRPPESAALTLPGPSGAAALALAVDGFRLRGLATVHDEVVGKGLAWVLTGGDADPVEAVSVERLLELERETFMSLVRTPATLARMEHMVDTGRPLRN